MANKDIEASFESHVGAINRDRVRYHNVAYATFKKGARRVTKEARYDVEEQFVEKKSDYNLDGEVVDEGDWIPIGTVHKPGELTETQIPNEEFDESHFVITHHNPAAGANTGPSLGEAITEFVEREFFCTSVEDLGEIFDSLLESD